ncbi:MAG: hypothetical protein FJX76_24335, partial [Armatimonadetes bacterium]|nr:hypothetical protein [Armatimonadota bacterium]
LAGDAVGRARRLGPIAAASAALEAGTVLIEARPDDARPLLEEAARLGEEMRLPVVSAAARLGMARLGASGDVDPALGLLLQSRHATELADASWWLLPLVLQRAADAPQGVAAKAAQRLARNTPRNLLRALDGGRLSPAARRAAAAALAEIPGELARAALQRLAADEDTGVRRAATVALQATSAGAELPLVRICALGPMEVYRGDERVEEKTFRTQKIRLLLAYLAAHADRPVPEERLIEEFWPGDGDKGRNSLYNATSVLRKALDPGSETSRNRYILRVGDALQFDPEIPLWHDAEQLERAWTDGQRFDAEKRVSEASDQFRRMALLYRGPYLDGCYMDWAIDRRNRLEQNVLSAMVRVSEVSLDAGRPKEALEYAGRVLDIDPCHQESHWVAMQAYLASGRPEEAIRQFERCEKNLRREMGIDPLIKLVETYHRARLG